MALLKQICGYRAKISCLSNDKDPILVAIWNKNVEIVKYLLTLGVDVNIFNKWGSPLSNACRRAGYPIDDDERPYEIISLLLDYGANINEILPSTTPLWEHVLWYSNIKLIEMFVKKGIDCTMIDKKGNNIVDIFILFYLARKYNHKQIYSKCQLLIFFCELKERGAPISESDITYKLNVMTNNTENGCCRICFENKEMGIVLPCCHCFCNDCIPHLVECAICRSKIVNVC